MNKKNYRLPHAPSTAFSSIVGAQPNTPNPDV